jgi:hypothetical protein
MHSIHRYPLYPHRCKNVTSERGCRIACLYLTNSTLLHMKNKSLHTHEKSIVVLFLNNAGVEVQLHCSRNKLPECMGLVVRFKFRLRYHLVHSISKAVGPHFTSLHYSYNKTKEMHQFLKFIFGMELYMFRTGFPSIIRSQVLYTQQYVYVIQVVLTAC